MRYILAALSAALAVKADEFNMQEAEVSRQFSVNAYCGHKQYETLQWQGLTAGFVWTHTIYNQNNHTVGFIGYLPLDNSIYVVFKGTDDINSALTDLDTDKDPYRAWPECNCRVHDGFQKSADSVSGEVIAEVTRLKNIYTTAKVKTTGHSLGAAVAQLTGMWLMKAGIYVDNMINFGMPRVGDEDYATFSNNTWPNQWRMTHNADIIPHVPPQDWPFSFYHVATEVYEDKHGDYKICNGSGED